MKLPCEGYSPELHQGPISTSCNVQDSRGSSYTNTIPEPKQAPRPKHGSIRHSSPNAAMQRNVDEAPARPSLDPRLGL